MTWKGIRSLAVISILMVGLIFGAFGNASGYSPPDLDTAVTSPANDGGVAGATQQTNMSAFDAAIGDIGNEVVPQNELAFPDAVSSGLVRPATNKEVEALQKAWQDSERQYAEIIKPFYENRAELIGAMQEVIPVGHNWQDGVTGIVYETGIPDGKMVTFEHYGVKRTALEGESSSGKLSKKRAQELGYKV